MTLSDEMLNAKVLITVKTYPLPSRSYDELVCTAGLLESGEWIRIYPISYRFLRDDSQYKKFDWVELNLVHNSKDFRPESYRPKAGLDEVITTVTHIGTEHGWQRRRELILRDVFESMTALIQLAKGESRRSLGVLQPTEWVDFVIEEDEREWKQEWRDLLRQRSFLEDAYEQGTERRVVDKLPYKYSYKFLTAGDQQPRKLMIEDWEIGALYWNALRRANGNEQEANRQVRHKYWDEFIQSGKRDVYLFLGTTQQYHLVAPNPFVIIGVFYPPKQEAQQLSLF